MIGAPGETRADFEETKKLSAKLPMSLITSVFLLLIRKQNYTMNAKRKAGCYRRIILTRKTG